MALTVGLRRSDEIRSCRYLSGVDQSQVVTTTLRSTPVRPRRLVLGQFALRDAIGPVAEVFVRHAAELAGDAVGHHLAGLAGGDAADPGIRARVELAELRRDRARRFLAELMAADAVDVVHPLEPDLPRDVLRNVGVPAEVAAGGIFIIVYQ